MIWSNTPCFKSSDWGSRIGIGYGGLDLVRLEEGGAPEQISATCIVNCDIEVRFNFWAFATRLTALEVTKLNSTEHRLRCISICTQDSLFMLQP